MSEIKRIHDQLRRAFEGTAWHGPSLKEILADISSDKAAANPIPGLHSIWEIVLHITAWDGIVKRRLGGEIVEPSDQEDWPAIQDRSDQAWGQAVQELERGHQALRETVSLIDDARLAEIVPGTNYSVYFMLHGVIQHDLYHAGQIALLKKAQG